MKQGVRYNTRTGYDFVLKLIKKEDIGYKQICDIKMSDVKIWVIKLHNDGKRYSTNQAGDDYVDAGQRDIPYIGKAAGKILQKH